MKKIVKHLLKKILSFIAKILMPLQRELFNEISKSFREELFRDFSDDPRQWFTNNTIRRNGFLMMIEKERRAVASTLDYIEKEGIHQKQYVIEPHYDEKGHRTITSHFRKTLELIPTDISKDSLILEFGVYRATSINLLAKAFPHMDIHGFDSFEGLPEDWYNYDRRFWDRSHLPLPQVEKNVILHVGYFDKVLPAFVEEHKDKKIAFLHIDCDVYSSTKTVFDALKNQIVIGTIIRFDELFGYHGYEFHEMKAFREFIEEMEVEFEALNYSFMALSLKITKIKHHKKF